MWEVLTDFIMYLMKLCRKRVEIISELNRTRENPLTSDAAVCMLSKFGLITFFFLNFKGRCSQKQTSYVVSSLASSEAFS